MIDGELNVLPLFAGMAILTEILCSLPHLPLDLGGELAARHYEALGLEEVKYRLRMVRLTKLR